jgi:solute carrier family 6 GABA transporter-like protein 1
MALTQYLQKLTHARWFTKVANTVAPPPDKSTDGRDQWPSRAAFLLAAMGGCAGQGNLLRYPSVVYNNYGLQWFIPYLLAVFLIAIPALILEVSIGQAYRGGTMIAFNGINRRLRGVGIGPVLVSFIVVQYFTVNLAWIMSYFRYSFTSPLPWEGRINEFYNDDVVANPQIIEGGLQNGGKDITIYSYYPAVGLIGETVGWSAFIWFLMWISIVRGVGLTGRVVYFSMGIPIVTTIIFVGRSVSLDNAGEGIRLLWATWRGDQLASGTVWQTAVGQVFFSTGIGFGYFTSYASYNAKYSNAVMDALLICGSNVLFENFAAFAVFGVVGFLRLWPDESERLGAFVVGFYTLPEAVLQMPGANFWAVLLFFTLIVLGYSSAFVMLDVVATLICDAHTRVSRAWVVTGLTLTSFLLCLPYCSEFGYHLLNGVDRWVNNVALIFVVWSEVTGSTTLYRYRDVVGQTRTPAFCLYNAGFFAAQLVGITVGHTTGRPGIGVAVAVAVYVLATAAALLCAPAPHVPAPAFWNRSPWLARFWYLAFYSGNQLRRDLNQIVGRGANWKIPVFWPVLLRYVSGPVLAIIFSFAFPEFHLLRYDPMMIAGFILSMLVLTAVAVGCVLPRYLAPLLPMERRDGFMKDTVVNRVGIVEDEAGEEVMGREVRDEEEMVVVGGKRGGC